MVVVPCSVGTKNGSLIYGFSGSTGPKITVPVSELILPLTDSSGSSPTYRNGEEACTLGIMSSGSTGVSLLGDTFLRSAYVVYDLANNMIALANTDFNATATNVVAFASQKAAIPSASAVSSTAASVTQTATGIPGVETANSAAGTATSLDTGSQSTGTLSAAAGFTATGTSSSSSTSTSTHKSAAGRTVPGLDVSLLAMLGGSVVAMVCGGVGFTLL